MTKIEIKSRPGTFITLDDDVAAKIGHWNWRLNKEGYVRAHIPGSGQNSKNGGGKDMPCAHGVMLVKNGELPQKGMKVDHINHDLLDNRYSNLRIVPAYINSRNTLKRKGTVSKFKGVYQKKPHDIWRGHVGIQKNGKIIHFIASETSDERIAAMARDCLTDLIGGFLLPNFPALSFKEKWQLIGEGQRNQILHSLTRNGITPKVV
jgi:hypothetical protein